MTTVRTTLGLLGVSYLAAWAVSLVSFLPWSQSAQDLLFRLREVSGIGRPGYDPRLALIDLTDGCYARIGTDLVSRERYAAQIEALSAMGVVVQVHDAVFRAAREGQGDRALEEAVRRADNVVFGIVAHNPVPMTGTTAPAAHRPVVGRGGGEVADAGETFGSHASLRDAARGHGLLNLEEDGDGVVRRVPLLLRAADGFHYGLALIAACEFHGVPPDQVVVGATSITLPAPAGEVVIPIDRRGRMRVNFVGPWGSMDHYRFADVWDAAQDPDELALWRSRLEGRITLVSDVSIAAGDLGAVPLESSTPLPGVHANALHTILTGRFLREVGTWPTLAAEMLLLIGLFLLARVRHSSFYLVGMPLLAIAYLGACAFAFLRYGWILELLRPTLLCGLALGLTMAVRYLHGERHQAILRASFESYFPPAVVRRLLADPQALDVRGHRRELTIPFSDVQGFTSMSSVMEPTEIHAMLNRYFEEMVDVAFAHGATVDKFIGDGLMLLFGDPEPQEDHAVRAARCALAMQQRVSILNQSRSAERKQPLTIRIGIHTGPVVVGNMGSKRRMTYTAIGAAVNLAARLEGAAPAGGILVSQRTRDLIGEAIPVQQLEPIQVKGVPDPVPVFLVSAEQGYVGP